jgi:hypothetical protein
MLNSCPKVSYPQSRTLIVIAVDRLPSRERSESKRFPQKGFLRTFNLLRPQNDLYDLGDRKSRPILRYD